MVIDQEDLFCKLRTTVHTFNDSSFPHLSLGYSTDACGSLIIHILQIKSNTTQQAGKSEEMYPCLYTAEATEFFVTRFLPFSYEAVDEICQTKETGSLHLLGVSITLLQQPVIKLSRYCFAFVVEFVYVT